MGYKKGNKYLYIILTIFLVSGLFLVTINYYSNKALTGTRGYISGEGHWIKAQKNSVIELIFFTYSQNFEYYESFNHSINVMEGLKQTRLTLSSDNPDYDVAYNGLLQGNIQPDEIDPIIWLFRNFKNNTSLKQAISYWEEADLKTEELTTLGSEIYALITEDNLSEAEARNFIRQIYALDNELSVIHQNFSESIRETANFIDSFNRNFTFYIGFFLILAGCLLIFYLFRLFNKFNDQLISTEYKLRNILGNSQDIIFQMDSKGTKYEYVSPSVEKLLGYKVEEIINGGPEKVLEKVHPDDLKRLKEDRELFAEKTLEKQLEHDTEYRIKTKSGKYIWVNNKRSLLKDKHGIAYGIVGNVRDITENKANLETINQSLHEKETLLIEIHHRVKNNLAIISGLIELQKEGANEKTNVKEVLEEIQSRIQSIVLVHEKLYQSDALSDINISDYIEELTDYISGVLNDSNKSIEVTKNLEDIRFNIIHAIPFGLVYNELIVNVYKHAFNGKQKNCLAKVDLQLIGNEVILSVADNGVGLPEDFNLDNAETLGLTLIKSLSMQLNGKMEITQSDWTEFKLTFEMPSQDMSKIT